MNGLSICSGIGGLDLGVGLAVPQYRTVCYVEIEAYPQDILLARMADGVLDRAPIWGDLKQFDGGGWRGVVDLVHGGYPCQPFSVAGKRAGTDDPRHLWPHIVRILAECEPEWCFFENVAGHLTLGFEQVARDLEALDYRVAAGLFTAAEVGAPHRRQRLFILAHREGTRGINAETEAYSGPDGRQGGGRSVRDGGPVGHADDAGLEGRGEPQREGPNKRVAWPPGPEERDRWATVLSERPELAPAVAYAGHDRPWGRGGHEQVSSPVRNQGGGDDPERSGWATQPAVRRVADGLPHRVDRLKALGNAVVPDVAALAWRTLRAQLNP